MIDIDDVRETVEGMKRKEILEQHPYEIWKASCGRWKTYVFDDNKNKRRLVSRLDKKVLEDYVINDYVKKHPNKTTVKDIFDEWMVFAVRDKDIEKSTMDKYQNDFDRFILNTNFSKLDVRDVTSNDVIRFLKYTINNGYKQEKITRKTFNNIKIILNGMFSYAKSEKNLECLSMSYTLKDFKVSDKKFKQVIFKDSEQVYNEEESMLIANYIINNYKSTRELGVLLALLTGVRVGELSSLKYKDQDSDVLYIQRTEIKYKDENGRTVYKVRDFPKTQESMNGIELTDSAIMIISLIKKINMKNGINSEYLFYEEQHGRLRSYFFNKTLKKICEEVNIPFRSMHKLRKTYASYLLANGVDEKITQMQLRHKDSSTTHKHYEFAVKNRKYKRDALNKVDILKQCKNL